MAKKQVFISMGSPHSATQERFRDALMGLLSECGVEPRVINKTDYPTGNPLSDIAKILRECDGAIIVAHERTFLQSGAERRKSPQEKPLKSVRYSTPWSHIESSMAFVLGLPILVLVENGLKEEGLLEPKYDWYVMRVDISETAFSDRDVRARLLAWCRKVQTENRKVAQTRIDDAITLRDLWPLLSLKMITMLGGAALFFFSLGVASQLPQELIKNWLKSKGWI